MCVWGGGRGCGIYRTGAIYTGRDHSSTEVGFEEEICQRRYSGSVQASFVMYIDVPRLPSKNADFAKFVTGRKNNSSQNNYGFGEEAHVFCYTVLGNLAMALKKA